MGKKLPYTPGSKMKHWIRPGSMRSREVQQVRKRDNYTCQHCHRKQTLAKGKELKVQVHHTRPPNWERIFLVLREELLNPTNMICLCEECHTAEHAKDGSGWEGHIKRKKPKQEGEGGLIWELNHQIPQPPGRHPGSPTSGQPARSMC